MELSASMDNDSGYVSHYQESTCDFSTENIYKTRSCVTQDIYMNEDALLEKPLLMNNCVKCKRCDSFDSIVNNSQESVKTEFSGFEDSDRSDGSFVIPKAKSLVVDSRDWKETSTSENEDSMTKCLNCSKESADSFIEPSPKRTKTPLKVLANVTNTYEQNANHSVMKNIFNDGNKENIRPNIITPKKLYENRVNADLSPDLFSDEDSISSHVMMPVKQKSPVKRRENYLSKDVKLLRRVQGCLSGVHPPPSLTVVQMTATEMLEKIDKNKELFWTIGENEGQGKSLLINSKFEAVNNSWPNILCSRYHGLHHNRGRISEDFEHLCSRYAERYIGAETQSTCTVFESNPSSSQKRKFCKPRWTAKSPGRRLSHLARRRITFSSANLQTANSSAILGPRARQILVDAKKLTHLSRKSPRKSPRKTPSKSPFKMRKTTPSSSAKKKLALRFREMSGEFEASTSSSSSNLSFHSLKRTLFASPKHEKSLNISGGTLEKRSTKRALFASPHKNSPQKSPFKLADRKRKRTDVEEENPSKFSRSMSLDLLPPKSDSRGLLNRTLSDSNVRPVSSKQEELSEVHKKKLQWAVYESLRLQNITAAHSQYKVFASVLARVTRRFLPSLRLEGRTTEKMFRIARHHSYAVVKGKTVDEIVNEYMKNKLKNQKPQGYVGIEDFNKRESINKENVLQDKVLESLEKRREIAGVKSRFVSKNKIDQIKKVISFEENSK